MKWVGFGMKRAESVQPALVAAVDCGLLFVFSLLTSGYLSTVNLFYFSVLTNIHRLVFCLQQEGCEPTRRTASPLVKT